MLADNRRVTSPDGSEVYVFSGAGRHLRTESALTGRTILTFHYDEQERLDSITDANSNVVSITRDADAHTFTITGPMGAAVTVTLDGDRWLEVPRTRRRSLSTSAGVGGNRHRAHAQWLAERVGTLPSRPRDKPVTPPF